MRAGICLVVSGLAACGPSVATVTTDPANVTLTEKGKTAVIKAEPKDAQGQVLVDAILKMQWSSSNPAVATVDKGVVTAVSSGEAKISASVGQVSGATNVIVSIPAKLEVKPSTIAIGGVDKEASLVAIVTDSTGRALKDHPIAWSTSNNNVVSVNEGKLLSTGAGSAMITARVGTLVATSSVSVKIPPIAKMWIDPAEITLEKVGDARRVKAVASDGGGAEIRGLTVTWTSADARIAEVSEQGQVRAVKKGKTKIKATAGESSAEATVVVK